MYKYVLQLFRFVSIGRVHMSSLATDKKNIVLTFLIVVYVRGK